MSMKLLPRSSYNAGWLTCPDPLPKACLWVFKGAHMWTWESGTKTPPFHLWNSMSFESQPNKPKDTTQFRVKFLFSESSHLYAISNTKFSNCVTINLLTSTTTVLMITVLLILTGGRMSTLSNLILRGQQLFWPVSPRNSTWSPDFSLIGKCTYLHAVTQEDEKLMVRTLP